MTDDGGAILAAVADLASIRADVRKIGAEVTRIHEEVAWLRELVDNRVSAVAAEQLDARQQLAHLVELTDRAAPLLERARPLLDNPAARFFGGKRG